MQHNFQQPGQEETNHEAHVQGLSALVARVHALQALVGDEESAELAASDVPVLRQGLRELAQMAGKLLDEFQMENSGLLLAEPPDLPLAEALSQLVENTAEKLGISSRLVFAGREQPLPDQLARLLYRSAQEALVRVSAHEGTRRLRFSLDYREVEVVASIEDDGVPGSAELLFESEAGEAMALPPFLVAEQVANNDRAANLVLQRLRRMVENLGGALTLNSGIEQGNQVQIRLPYLVPELPVEPAPRREPEIQVEPVSRIRVLIVDNQAVSRAGLRRLLESYPDLEVVGEASDSVQAVSETAELLPQVVLIDAHLPGEQSLETLRQLRQLNAAISVLLLADREYEELLYEALRAGASGYLLKDIAPDELARSVRTAARGEVLVQPQLAARLLARFGGNERASSHAPESLTTREREVLQLLARGLRNKEIAARLIVSERTVNFHLANIYAKLHVSGRTEALSKALEQGLLKV